MRGIEGRAVQREPAQPYGRIAAVLRVAAWSLLFVALSAWTVAIVGSLLGWQEPGPLALVALFAWTLAIIARWCAAAARPR